MLILSRKIGESLVIGDDADPVTVTVISIQGNQVKIGISARETIPVDREEIRRMKKSFARKSILESRREQREEIAEPVE